MYMMKRTINGLLATTLIVGSAQAMELNEDQEFERALKNSIMTAQEESALRDRENEDLKRAVSESEKLVQQNNQLVEQQNQIIGVQAIGAAYQFTKDDKIVEQAKRILEMGSKTIKIKVENEKSPELDAILKMPFDTFFFWWRSGSKKKDLSESDKVAEYKETYNFAKHLLTSNANLKRNFYLGNWEGDWYLLPNYDTNFIPTQSSIKGMIEWFNIRQKAVDDARKDVGSDTLSKVYHYAEVNRVRDAMVHNKDRLVNKVLPHTNVDYVSYSAYDVQKEKQETINNTIKYIESNLTEKADVSGPRVFIGECGMQAMNCGIKIEDNKVVFNPEAHEKVNREICIKFLQSGVPYILYWEMYNNEVRDIKIKHKNGTVLGIKEKNEDIKANNEEVVLYMEKQQQGFWLIDDKNVKQPLYYTLENLYNAQKGFKDIRQNSIEWLKKCDKK